VIKIFGVPASHQWLIPVIQLLRRLGSGESQFEATLEK
jgi:hypothetical protein